MTRRSDQIVALPLTLGAPPIGEEKVVSVVEHASLIRPLLEQRLVTLLSSNRRLVARYNLWTAQAHIDGFLQFMDLERPAEDGAATNFRYLGFDLNEFGNVGPCWFSLPAVM
ncbi:hypothetical protein BGLA2_810022 [Burkholderia gladioli]|nr:hypothetical protein BGLA2_810022 [Burkholderia gladioli]